MSTRDHETAPRAAREWIPPWQRTRAENERLLSLVGNHPFIAQYEPQFLARGGEHIVYRSARYPELVLKVDADWLADSLTTFSDRVDARERELATWAHKRAERHRILAHFFGLEATLDVSVTVQSFPLSEEIVFEVCRKPLAAFPSHAKTVVLEQRYSEALSQGAALSFSSGYLEDIAELTADEYARVTEGLLVGAPSAQRAADFDSLYGRCGCKELFEQVRRDEKILAAMTEFLKQACAYSRETGETLDVAGQGNVAFVGSGSDIQVLLPDALAPGGGNSLMAAGAALNSFSQGENLSRKERFVVFNVLHYVRLVNGACALCGVEDTIAIPGVDTTALIPKLGELLEVIRMRTRV